MNNRQIVASLNEIANTLDNNGLYKEASDITKVMVKVSQIGVNPVVGQDIEFLQKHPSLMEEFNRLSNETPKEGMIDISDIYYKTPYWNMPQNIMEKDIPARLAKLKDFNYHKELARKRLDFINKKLESQRLSDADRSSLTSDLAYLKKYTGMGSLADNPASKKQTLTPQTAYDAMQNRGQSVLDSMKPKTPDYNQLVYNIVFKKIKQKNPQKSDTEIGLSLSNKTNLQGYKDISKNGNFVREILDEIEMYSKKYLNAEEINTILSKIFIDKISFSGVR